MPLLNPYGREMGESEFPLALAIIFGLGLILLGAAIFVLFIKKKDSPLRQRLPDWAINGAYPVFFLLLPFVMVVSVMLFLPKSWFGAERPASAPTQAASPSDPSNKRQFLNPDSLARLGQPDSIPADSAP